MSQTPLPAITALARSGSLDRAFALFEASGYGNATDNPAALAVKGRLLKDRGLKRTGPDRRAMLREAAECYRAADAIRPEPYLLINVATLSYLAGDAAAGAKLADAVLVQLEATGHSETPYWLAATRAEALLLKGERDLASAALATAIGHAPEAWEDHASTLRQFRLILAETGKEAVWLDAHRPPCSIHFAGHLGVAGKDEAHLHKDVAKLIDQERIGFAYGALAAGADIVIAEALLASGAELHAILPVPEGDFIARSITPMVGNWRARFEACMGAAKSILQASRIDGPFEPLTINLAGDIGMGSALLNARRLESRAAQLVVADEGAGTFGEGIHTARDAQRWRDRGFDQFVLRAPRTAIAASGQAAREQPVPSRRLVATLSIELAGADNIRDSEWPRIDALLMLPMENLASVASRTPILIQRWGNRIDLAFSEVEHAAHAGQSILDHFGKAASALPPSLSVVVGGHYDIMHASPAQGELRTFTGSGATLAHAIAQRSQPGSICVSEPFATALAFRDESLSAEFMGEHQISPALDPVKLFALKAV